MSAQQLFLLTPESCLQFLLNLFLPSSTLKTDPRAYEYNPHYSAYQVCWHIRPTPMPPDSRRHPLGYALHVRAHPYHAPTNPVPKLRSFSEVPGQSHSITLCKYPDRRQRVGSLFGCQALPYSESHSQERRSSGHE